MDLGAFSISLAVKDIEASKAFYEKLGFEVFHGMFEKNILTFNPGWDSNAQKIDSFTDVRDLQRQLRAKGMQFESEADESKAGPASFIVVDPDGNPILFDQHV